MKPVLIIAEAGVNHNGSLETARRLIDAAADAGVDYVKFQTFKAANLVSKAAQKADYQKQNTLSDKNDSQFDMLKKLELSYEDHLELISYCKKKNVKFFSTAFDLESIDMLQGFGPTLWKVPSGEITNKPYLQKIGALGTDVILSTGMCTIDEIRDAIYVLEQSGTPLKSITVLHCNTEYPTPMEDVNLRAMLTIRDELSVNTGYSDHTAGIEIPIAAVALGAQVIEKHFTLDRNMEGPDHKASLEPGQLKEMVHSIRNIEKALGNGIKKPSASELKNMAIARKSIHVVTTLEAGHIVSSADITMKRPGNGISPMLMDEVIAQKIHKTIKADELLTWAHLGIINKDTKAG